VSFFDDTPERVPPPFDRPGRPAWMRPDGVIPGVARVGLFLIRSDEMAVAVGSMHGYPNGFEFTVHARLRHEQFVWGKSPLDSLADPRTRQEPEQALRLGVLYADGRRARTSSYRPIPVPADEDDGEHLVLSEVGTGGTERQWDGCFWVHPLPPDGPVTFVASWLLYRVVEARQELDSSVIREAAGRAVILWPDQPSQTSSTMPT
jgi:hypothetical protein